jgi:hypothetical protein
MIGFSMLTILFIVYIYTPGCFRATVCLGCTCWPNSVSEQERFYRLAVWAVSIKYPAQQTRSLPEDCLALHRTINDSVGVPGDPRQPQEDLNGVGSWATQYTQVTNDHPHDQLDSVGVSPR